ncbi:MAG: type II toxin-antitoxin system VapC family toxin [Acetobacteraceae bacterium]|nr:type II toxin-antitoxin system VapC family toxin [Acetobacteraceae bacterium]
MILDTNVLSALMHRPADERVTEWLDTQPTLSVWTTSVTVFEIRVGLEALAPGRRRRSLEAEFERVLNDDIEGRILPFDTDAATAAAILAAARQRAGRPGELRDTMIAGIVLASHATFATRNTRHFADLTVPVIDPWQG